MKKVTTATKTEIKSAAIARCTDKATKEVFYLVKSDSSDAWYQVRWNGTQWMCNCPATKPCKHMRAVNEVLAIRRARVAEEMGGDVPAIVATIQDEDDKRRAFSALKTQFDCRQPVVAAASTKQQREAAPLNGNRAFAFMR